MVARAMVARAMVARARTEMERRTRFAFSHKTLGVAGAAVESVPTSEPAAVGGVVVLAAVMLVWAGSSGTPQALPTLWLGLERRYVRVFLSQPLHEVKRSERVVWPMVMAFW
jgi:hypothetical protein